MVNLQRIKLVNFIGIYLGTGLKEIEIDRTGSPNNIILILGENGSGKSSLLNEITPLPLEHMGPRNSSRILAGETGIKELDFLVDGVVLYKIKIVYAPTKPTKCYITKHVDGKEIDLNPNGNVESYLEVIENELHMSKNYTNVGYLCGNGKSKNFVGMKPTERNNYISEWLPSIAEFLDAYKLSAKILGKLKKDIDNYNKQIGNMSTINYELELGYINNNLEQMNKRLKKIETETTELNVYTDQLRKHYRTEKELNVLKRKFLDFVDKTQLKRREFIEKWSGINIPDINNYEEFTTRKNEIKEMYSKCFSKINSIEMTMQLLSNDIKTSQSMLSTDTRISGVDINMILNNIESNKSLLNDIEQSINDIQSKYESDEKGLRITSTQISDINSIIQILDDKFIQLNNLISLDLIRDMDDLDKSLVNKAERHKLVSEMLLSTQEKLTFVNNEIYKYENSNLDEKILMKRPEFCMDKTCGVINELLKYLNPKDNLSDLYKESKELENRKIDLSGELQEIDTSIENYKKSMQIHLEITDFMYKNNEKIAVLPTPIVKLLTESPSSVYTHINDIKSIIAELTEFSTLCDKRDDITKTNEDLENVKNLVFTNDKIDSKIKEDMRKLEELRAERSVLLKDFDTICKESELYDNAESKVKEYEDDLVDINNDIRKSNMIRKHLLQLAEASYYFASNTNYIENTLKIQETSIKKEIMDLNKKRDEMTTFYVSKRQIEKMRNELQEEFNRINILNKIWSPKVGYPSWKIDSFLSDLTIKTNDDLTNMWGAGNIKIKDFKIDQSDFNIVGMKDGVEIKDVSLMSEGETQTINTAISFSIIESNIDNGGYDIVKLDEIDGAFDDIRRHNFIDMIQRRMDEMGVDSCFIISHNNAFDEVPCDVILMKGAKITDEQLKNKRVLFHY